MSSQLKNIMSERLTHLMRVNPSLDTLHKVAERSGVSYGTVQRLKKGDETDVAITKVEMIAKCFGLTLSEFISEPGAGFKASAEEFSMLHTFRELDEKDRAELMFFASMKKARPKGLLG